MGRPASRVIAAAGALSLVLFLGGVGAGVGPALAATVAERLAAEEPGVAVDPATGEIIDPPPPPNPGEAAR